MTDIVRALITFGGNQEFRRYAERVSRLLSLRYETPATLSLPVHCTVRAPFEVSQEVFHSACVRLAERVCEIPITTAAVVGIEKWEDPKRVIVAKLAESSGYRELFKLCGEVFNIPAQPLEGTMHLTLAKSLPELAAMRQKMLEAVQGVSKPEGEFPLDTVLIYVWRDGSWAQLMSLDLRVLRIN